MRKLVVLLFAVLALISAGCFGFDFGPNLPSEPFTAKENAENFSTVRSLHRMLDLDPPDTDAYSLHAALGFDYQDPHSSKLEPFKDSNLYQASRDNGAETVGDGIAPSWKYLHGSDEEEAWLAIRFGVGLGGYTPVSEGGWSFPPLVRGLQYGGPLGDDWMDSDEAASHARSLDAEWDAAMEGAAGTVAMLVYNPDHLPGPAWGFSYWPDRGGDPLGVYFDAVDGTPLTQEEFFNPVEPVKDQATFTLQPGDPIEQKVEVHERQLGLSLRLELHEPEGPGAELVEAPDLFIKIVSPRETITQTQNSQWPEPMEAVEDVYAGTWSIEIQTHSDTQGPLAQLLEIRHQVTLNWCTDGTLPFGLGTGPGVHECL